MSRLRSAEMPGIGPSHPATHRVSVSTVLWRLYGLLIIVFLAIVVASLTLAYRAYVEGRPFNGPSGPPPAPGAVLAWSSLTVPGEISSPRTVQAQVTQDGYLITGSPNPARNSTQYSWIRHRHPLPKDGEFRLSAKVVSGHQRAVYRITLSGGSISLSEVGHWLDIAPAQGWVTLKPYDTFVGSIWPGLATRRGLAGRLHHDDWNTIAVRLRGDDIWVLIDDELVLTAHDQARPRYPLHDFAISVYEDPHSQDGPPVAVIFKQFQYSALRSEP